MSKEKILINVSGPDKPGITYKLLSVIDSSNCQVCDLGQSVTHGLLSLSIFIELGSEDEEYPVIKDLLFSAKKLGMELDFKIYDKNEKIPTTNNDRFILNCVSTGTIPTAFLKEVSGTLSNNNVNILRLDTTTPNSFSSLEIITTIPPSLIVDKLKAELLEISNKHSVDAAFLKDNIWRRNKRLIVFDMDSTLIQSEVIDEMAKDHGVEKEVSEITELAMNGELDFNESLIKRVSMLEGLEEKKLGEILDRLEYTKGAREFISAVKKLGYKVALISGGFTFFANALKEKLGLDYAFANELEIKNNKLTGKVAGTIINAERKATLLRLITQQEKLHLEQVVAIGDGANDLPMLSSAGLGIAYHAKDIVRKKAGHHMSHGPMTTILHFLGVDDPDFL
jgi:phosphoserine phosphatase